MGVDVAGGADVTVAQPLLDVLESHTVCIEQGRTGVPEIVETDAAQSVLFQKLREGLREIPRLDPISDLLSTASAA